MTTNDKGETMTDEKEQPHDDDPESETATNEATITATVTADAEVVHPVEDDEEEG